ncbi:MAG: phosphate transport system regulatory protein PhoU [marine bacterium B5-7]|nr:MAG: phosphate transport system regulatory protein PhoU [marine bacterium B5-7]
MNSKSTARSNSEGHIFHRFDEELQSLIKLVGEMGELATEQVREAGKAIKKGSLERARSVVNRENRIDQLDIAIDEEIHRVLALRAPMAKDLRILLTVNRIGSFLERIGDQANGIAELALFLFKEDSSDPDKRLLSGIPRMAKYVIAMVEMSIQSFKRMDIELALEVIEMDRDLNEQFDTSIRSLTTYVLEDPRRIGDAVQVVLGLRSLDRIGGHAKSISRQVIFMVKGVNVRHQSVEILAAEIRAGSLG